ncbi:MAG: beta-lactamase family protein [Melioribacteraceae bacterium]|nr:beta-lactamase family protein [Melioribacteraceae bacterium]
MKSKLIYKLILLLFCSVFGNSINSQTIKTHDDYYNSQLDLISDYILQFPNNSQLSIAIVNKNDINFIGAKKNHGKFLLIDNKDSVFEIGSITKIFTSTILSRLAIDSVINLDASIEGILPYKIKQISKDKIPITLRTLANHTSGLEFEPSNVNVSADKNPNNPYQAYDYKLFDEYLQNGLIVFNTPGTTYQYSNLGYGLLGYLLETFTVKEYETLFQDLVCEKYNLRYSSTDYIKVEKLTVHSIDTSGHILPHWNCNALKSSGGILSNVNDLSKFLIFNFKDDSVLDLQRKMTFSKMNNHTALGWEVFKIGGGKFNLNWYYKTGGMGGYSSAIIMDTKSQLGIVILSNISAYNKSQNTLQLGIELLKNLFIVNKENLNNCGAPFLEMALKEGWGTWGKSIHDSIFIKASKKKSLVGIWQKPSNSRSHLGINYETRTFMPNGKVQSDFMGNPEIDVWGYYYASGNQIEIEDIGGNACENNGVYKYFIDNDTLTFKPIQDNCDGRLNGLSGKWMRKK